MGSWRELALAVLSLLGLLQTGFIFRRNRQDKVREADQRECDTHQADCNVAHEAALKNIQFLRDRMGVVETRCDNFDRESNQNREFQAQLVSRIDEIHRSMLTKDDLKILVEFIKRDKE